MHKGLRDSSADGFSSTVLDGSTYGADELSSDTLNVRDSADDGRREGGAGTNDACDGLSCSCGDGVLQDFEECEDGNRTSGDGCSANCDLEIHCPPNAEPGVSCFPTLTCGDGMQTRNEQCDDGNTASGDGCSNSCRIEPDFVCPRVGAPCVFQGG